MIKTIGKVSLRVSRRSIAVATVVAYVFRGFRFSIAVATVVAFVSKGFKSFRKKSGCRDPRK